MDAKKPRWMKENEVENINYKREPRADFAITSANLERGSLATKRSGWTEEKEAKNRCCKPEPRAEE